MSKDEQDLLVRLISVRGADEISRNILGMSAPKATVQRILAGVVKRALAEQELYGQSKHAMETAGGLHLTT